MRLGETVCVTPPLNNRDYNVDQNDRDYDYDFCTAKTI